MLELWHAVRDVLAVIGAIWVFLLLVLLALVGWLWWMGHDVVRPYADEEQELQERGS